MTDIKLNKVKITSKFWNHYRKLIVDQLLPYQWDVINDKADIKLADDPQQNQVDQSANSHAIANLKIAAGEMKGRHKGYPFQDTDVYKWLETAAYSLVYHPDKNLRKITDSLIDLIGKAQEPDGYLSTMFQLNMPDRKFKRLQQSHELYTMGHYIEAGVAYYGVTGNKKALEIAEKMANCIDNHFGPEDNKIHGVDGHPEIELALARLYEVTHNQKYLDLAHYFLNERGQDPDFFDKQNVADGIDRDFFTGMKELPKEYYLTQCPIKDQDAPHGHAVRVLYLCTGMAHVARLTGDKDLLAACDRFWNDIVKRQMYITGNVGQTTHGEAFTYDYDLPNDTDYGETCASVAMTFFARQMMKIKSKGEYGDIIEKELFNGALAGVSLDGKHFFYVNPLEADPKASKWSPDKTHILTHRAAWFGCACCPANISRLIASVDRYIYTVKDNTILSHQFIANETSFDNGSVIKQESNFPWDGDIKYEIKAGKSPFTFAIRIPSWSPDFKLSVDGTKITDTDMKDGFIYFKVDKDLSIELQLDMGIKYMEANNRVKHDYGKVAIQRGPIVYAAEEEDNEAPLWLSKIVVNGKNHADFEKDLLGGVTTVTVDAKRQKIESDDAPLYRDASEKPDVEDKPLKMVPYYSWANRKNGQMQVWFDED